MEAFIVEQSIIDDFASEKPDDIQKLADIHRINCLAGLCSANHGWLGACFSSIEILTCIYHYYIKDPIAPLSQRASVHISKGHAAMAQYAILAAIKAFPLSRLTTYKALNGLPAHCDRTIPGVDSDSGSLGQGLSKAIGNAIANESNSKKHPVFALIGDGELQEGQVFESLLTLKKLNPWGVVPIIDRNFLQSDSQTSAIKDADSWSTVFTGIGLEVHTVNGHCIDDIALAIDSILSSPRPGIIIALTKKGYGTDLTVMNRNTPRRQGVWHGRIPSQSEYFKITEELVTRINNHKLTSTWKSYCKGQELFKEENHIEDNLDMISTTEAFSNSILELAAADKDVFVLDADLEKSCRLTKVAEKFGNRYLEIGISEQDMTSIASGLALAGKVAVVNTYASFYKRSLDQIFACATEESGAIFAGHYAGIDYFTDGKSHQSVNDIGLMLALGNIDIFEPFDAKSTREILAFALNRIKNSIKKNGRAKPIYIRLHRTPQRSFNAIPFSESEPAVFRAVSDNSSDDILITSGPHMLDIAFEVASKMKSEHINLDIIALTHFSDEKKIIKKLTEKAKRIYVLEDHRRESGIGSFVSAITTCKPVCIGIRNYFQSTLTFKEMIYQHQLDSETVCGVIRKVKSCSHHK